MAERRAGSQQTWQTRPRRRAIEAALRRRPDLDLDALRAVLDRLGFAADEATLIADLDALGYDVEGAGSDEADGAVTADGEAEREDDRAGSDAAGPGADDRPADDEGDEGDEAAEGSSSPARRSRPWAADLPSFLPPSDDGAAAEPEPEVEVGSAPSASPPAPIAPAVVTVTSASRPSDRAEEIDAFADPVAAAPDAVVAPDDGPRPTRRRRVAAIGAVIAAAAVVVAALVLPPDDVSPAADDVDSAAGATDEESAAPGPDGPAPSTTAPPPPDRRDPALADPAAVDLALTFDGTAPELPVVDDLGAWRTVGGDWSVLEGVARVDMGAAPRSVAVLEAPGPDLRAEVTLPDGTSGAGLAFRFEDEGTYLAWVIAPRFFTANLYRVANGRARLVKNSGVTAVPPGVRVGVHVVDRLVELLVDGKVVATFDDVWSTSAQGIGLVSMEEGQQPAFDDLRVLFSS